MFICGDAMQSDINRKSGFNKLKELFGDDASHNQSIHNFEFNHRDIKVKY